MKIAGILFGMVLIVVMVAGCAPNGQTSESVPTTKEVEKDGDGRLTVMMSGVTFMPPLIDVKPGDEIRFMNINSYTHTVTIPDLDIDERVDGGQSFIVKVDKAGVFNLKCTIHVPRMVGEITST